jgi:shikimate dehydrogenase
MPAMTGRTRVIGIIGDPVEHSLSPAMHNAAFRRLGLDAVYVPFRVEPADLEEAMAGVRALGIAGLNVTVPHKEAVIPLLDGLSAEARTLAAVNTIVRRGPRLLGHNTDSRGFRAALAAARVNVAGRSCLVIGAGGSARAVSAALIAARCRELTVVNRTRRRAERLTRLMRRLRRGRQRLRAAPWSALADRGTLEGVDIVVNCTPVGLGGRALHALAYDATARTCLFVDLVYGATPTPFLAQARRLGRRTLDGLGMLLHQGALAFTLWTGREAPLATMAAALHRARPGARAALTQLGASSKRSPTAPRRRRR